MAKTSCPNGHGMWDGDGTPSVWAYRVQYKERCAWKSGHSYAFRNTLYEIPERRNDMKGGTACVRQAWQYRQSKEKAREAP